MTWSIGAICVAISLSILAGSSSGPAALCGFNFCNSLEMPWVEMIISGEVGWVEASSRLFGGSCFSLKTDWNCLLRAFPSKLLVSYVYITIWQIS